MERISGGRTSSSTCPCPYLDGMTGGPGPVRRFTLVVQHLIRPSLVAGLDKVHVTVNGTIPGPPIVVNAGDWLEISVVNNLPNEPTILHFHGQLQVMTPSQGGVVALTQCAIQPGKTLVYAFRASNAGTYWYHGSHLEQYSDGLFGLLQVLPARGSSEDLARGLSLATGADNEVFLMLQDYYNNQAHELLTLFYISPESEGLEPVPDAIQINGKHKGQLFMQAPRAGKTLVHVICASAFSSFRVSIDGVNLQLVEVDGTAILPLTVPHININVGQRMSFVVDWGTLAPSVVSGVFLRAVVRTDRYDRDLTGYVPPYELSLLQNPPLPLDPNYTAVFQFAPLAPDGSGTQLPSYAASGPNVPVAPAIAVPASGPYAGLDTGAAGRIDANVLDAVPTVLMPVPPGTHQLYLEVSFAVDPESEVLLGFFNKVYHVHNSKGGMMPSLFDKSVYGMPEGSASAFNPAEYYRSARKPFGYASSGLPLPPLPIAFTDEAHYLLPPGAVVVMLINNTAAAEMPLYLHGHTVWVLATSERPGGEAARIATGTAVRRDTVSVPGFGWAKVAFVAENPGIWRVHTMVDWHVNVGLTLNLYEGLASLDRLPVSPAHQENCNLPQPGAASWVLHASVALGSSGNASSHEKLPAVQAASCANGEVSRACTFMERAATDFGNATMCACPLAEEAEDDGDGDVDGAASFDILIDHLFIPEPLVPGAFKLTFGMNGISPGPTLEVEEGSWVRVAVTSILEGDHSALQFQGQDLVLTPYAAGVPDVSQCGIEQDNTIDMAFRATRAGVFLYRGTHNEQDVDGLVGALIVRPRDDGRGSPALQPPSADTEFVLLLGEHFIANTHNIIGSYFHSPASGGVPPLPNAITVNTKVSGVLELDAVSRSSTSVFHLIGAHSLSVLDVSIDGVALQVFAVDGTALAAPFLSLRSVAVTAGQRVSVLVDWGQLPPYTPAHNAPAGEGVFLRVTARTAAYLRANPATWINPFDVAYKGITPLDPQCLVVVRFGGTAARVAPAYPAAGPGVPAFPPSAAAAPADTNLLDARPALAAVPPAATHELYLELGTVHEASSGKTRYAVNGASWTTATDGRGGLVPQLWRYMRYGTADGGALPANASDFPFAARGNAAAAAAAGVVAAAGTGAGAGAPPAQAIAYDAKMHYLIPSGAVVLVFLNNTHARERSMRADGHTFFVLSTSDHPGAEVAHAGNWLRRDVVSVPARGWARLLFVADNPGVWRFGSPSVWGIAGGEAIELFEALPLLAGLDVPPNDRAICGMPSLFEAPTPRPSPTPAPAAAAAAAGLSASQLLIVIIVPICTVTLLVSLAMRTQMCNVARLSEKILPA